VLRLRAYGKAVNKYTNSVGHVQWVEDTTLYGYVRYSMLQLRSMIHGLVESTRMELRREHGLVESTRMELRRELLLFEMDQAGNYMEGATRLPAVEWGRIVDHPAELRWGWDASQDPRNTFGGVNGASWLATRIIQEKKP
jgi:hypothetical protein